MIKSYATHNYKKMLRQPEGQLKHPFIVPGSVYANQLWDWDCWLTNVALRQFVEEDITQYERGCVLNFLEHIDDLGGDGGKRQREQQPADAAAAEIG